MTSTDRKHLAETLSEILTREQTAAALGISVAALDAERYRGRGPAFFRPMARTIRYRRADVEAYIASRTVGGRK